MYNNASIYKGNNSEDNIFFIPIKPAVGSIKIVMRYSVPL